MINKIKQRSKDYFHLLGLGCHSINYWLPGKLAVLPDIRGQTEAGMCSVDGVAQRQLPTVAQAGGEKGSQGLRKCLCQRAARW